MASNSTLLVLNSGSSSVKFALFDLTPDEPRRIWSGAVQRIGFDSGRFTVSDVEGTSLAEETLPVRDHAAALDRLLDWIGQQATQDKLVAVGHRMVHGGEDCDCSLPVTPQLEARLQQLIPLAPLHMPHNLAGIAAMRKRRPELVQIAAFDTAFHHGLPRIARMTGLPRRFLDSGIRRYGFHGLSYEYVVEDICRRGGHGGTGRMIVAHLGNGASMAAIRDGRSVETSMGFSTLAGLPMGTRPGDLDPGILLHLMLERQVCAEELQDILYRQSGLLGLSGLSRNMADLLARPDLPEAVEAVEFYCHHARRHLAGLTAALGGLDRLVFTGGIGANAPGIRARICDGLDYLGLALDAGRNNARQRVVSAKDSPVLIEAFKTDEELVIARHARNLLGASSIAGKAQNYG